MPNDPIAPFLEAREVMLLDGALATELERRGADLADPLWSARLLIERPDSIRTLHADYFIAGADVAITASYQASFEGLAQRGFDAAAATRLMRSAVTLAAEARDAFWAGAAHRAHRARPLVAASVGPYGAMRADGSEYRGDYGLSLDELKRFHRQRLHVLAASGADLLACETLPCLDEALALAQLLEDELPESAAWISFSCRDGAHTCQGEPIAECARRLDAYAQIVAIGVNCTAPQHVGELVRTIRANTGKPVLAYPNSGEHYDAANRRWLGCPGDRPFAEQARTWFDGGARLIGGCCRTTPEDIAALRRELLAPSPARGRGLG